MARSITLTLGAGMGADLGPNFNLTANVGSVTPSTATKTELTAGKSVSVDDAATQVTVTSTGTCTNAITQTIPCAGETSTTSTSTTSTSTTSTSTTTTSALQDVNITVCATSADGSGCIDVYAYSDIAVDTQISIPFSWTGDLSSNISSYVIINSGQTCGTVSACGAQVGENCSNFTDNGVISPAQSINQNYVLGNFSCGLGCAPC